MVELIPFFKPNHPEKKEEIENQTAYQGEIFPIILWRGFYVLW
jgi:hypothetical protein